MPKPHRRLSHTHVIELKYGIKFNAPFAERIFRCADPECYYRDSAGAVLGKRFKCPTCLSDYIADRDALMKKRPHCLACTKGKKAQKTVTDLKSIEERLKEVLGI